MPRDTEPSPAPGFPDTPLARGYTAGSVRARSSNGRHVRCRIEDIVHESKWRVGKDVPETGLQNGVAADQQGRDARTGARDNGWRLLADNDTVLHNHAPLNLQANGKILNERVARWFVSNLAVAGTGRLALRGAKFEGRR
jgi:hypothetical protein